MAFLFRWATAGIASCFLSLKIHVAHENLLPMGRAVQNLPNETQVCIKPETWAKAARFLASVCQFMAR